MPFWRSTAVMHERPTISKTRTPASIQVRKWGRHETCNPYLCVIFIQRVTYCTFNMLQLRIRCENHPSRIRRARLWHLRRSRPAGERPKLISFMSFIKHPGSKSFQKQDEVTHLLKCQPQKDATGLCKACLAVCAVGTSWRSGLSVQSFITRDMLASFFLLNMKETSTFHNLTEATRFRPYYGVHGNAC